MLKRICSLLMLGLLSACSSIPYQEGYPANSQWVLLPLINQTQTTYANEMTEKIILKQAPEVGIKHLTQAPAYHSNNPNANLRQIEQQQNAANWAVEHQYLLALTGTIENWEIRNGRLSLSLALQIKDPGANSNLWQSQTSASAKPDETPKQTVQRLVKASLNSIPINH